MKAHAHRKTTPKQKVLIAALSLFAIGFIGAGIIFLYVALTPTPDIAAFANRQVDQSTKIYDRTGQVLLYDYNQDARREVVPLSQVSPNAINATLAIEDSGFYQHGGIRLTSIIRAMLADVLGGGLAQGGSTITQQVVKNTLLTGEKSVSRKVHEWTLAIKLERAYSKNQILETYLNSIPYGGTLYGIEAASESYFGVSANDLTVPQSAYLAAMIQAPSHYSPYGNNRAALDTRAALVLSRMKDLGFITATDYKTAASTTISFSSRKDSSIVAPHFVFYILDYLEQKYGTTALANGLKVTTTLDAELEAKAEATLATYAAQNEKKFRASNDALVAVDPQTGQILAMVGSRNFFDPKIDGQYNAALASRQPGSTMKPFIYALALQKGYTRDTVVFDAPTQFSTVCSPNEITKDEPPCYAPQDFDGKFRGPMTFETALAQSINVPAIKLLYLVGIRNAINFAKSFGLSTLGNPDQYGLTLVLGGGEVRLLDMTSAYSVFATGGIKNDPTGILEVDDASGTVLESYTPSSRTVIPENIANNMNAMLSDAPARLPEYPLNSPLSFSGYDVAVKTGTTNDTRDAWVVGYTPSIALGVWAGNNNNSVMVKSIAGFIAAPMWHEVMAYALTKYSKTYFNSPDPISTDLPPILRGDWQTPDANGQIAPHDLLYWTDKTNPRGPAPLGAGNDPQYPYWEYGVSAWYASHPELFVNPPLMVPLTYSFNAPSAPTPQ